MRDYAIEKWIWTEKDFAQMGWHDSTVYGIRLKGNLELDIDYILQWNQPDVKGFQFTFWVAPATLIFEAPKDVAFELTQSIDDKWLEIQDIEMESIDRRKTWTIITQQGEISFVADTFKQIVRSRPTFQLGQSLPFDERGGISFDLASGENAAVIVRPEIAERRRRDFEAYEMAKAKFMLEKQSDELNDRRNAEEIPTKDYLIKKKELKEKINALIFQLRGTRYE